MTALEAIQDVPKEALGTEWLLYKETKIKEKETGGAELKAMMLKYHIDKRGPNVFTVGKMDTWNMTVDYSGKIPKKILKGTT